MCDKKDTADKFYVFLLMFLLTILEFWILLKEFLLNPMLFNFCMIRSWKHLHNRIKIFETERQ